MDRISEQIANKDSPGNLLASLKAFNTERATCFELNETLESRQKFCDGLLRLLAPDCALTSSELHNELIAEVLQALRIASREQSGIGALQARDGLCQVMQHSGLVKCNVKTEVERLKGDGSAQRIRVVLESVKCLCNVALKNSTSAKICGEEGVAAGLMERTLLWTACAVPNDVQFYDMRLLFVLAAISDAVKTSLRDEHNCFTKFIVTMDALIFGEQLEASQCSVGLKPRESVYCLSAALDRSIARVLSEMLKIIFNITLHWQEDEKMYTKEEIHTFKCFAHLLRILLVSVTPTAGDDEQLLIAHCIDALLNIPACCIDHLLLPCRVKIEPSYDSSLNEKLFSTALNRTYEDYNMAAVVALLNFVCYQLNQNETSSKFMPVASALRNTAATNRIIRKFLRQELLPPLGRVVTRPEVGDSLKSRLVKLMTTGSSGTEIVVADMFYILCKENPNRLVKHTGYGNAAGLLMARGMLGGHVAPKDYVYSEDENSDTEEYLSSKVNPVIGAPDKPSGPSPLESMSMEEKENEAAKLMDLIDQMNSRGVMQMVPLDQLGNPVIDPNNKEQANDSDKSSIKDSDDDDGD